MARLKISFFVHDLASNPIVRAAPLARALADHYDVEVLGFLLAGPAVYEPYRDLFEYKTIHCSRNLPSIVAALPRLAAMATGDVVYACKPLLTSLGPAVHAARVATHKRLLLDVEDDEWMTLGESWPAFLWRDVIKGWRHATAWKYTRLLHPFTKLVDGTSVASRKLQRRYGGVLVRHGPDERLFDPRGPGLADVASCRRTFRLPLDRRIALFAGVPQPHKGWDILLAALQRAECGTWDLAVAGPDDHPAFDAAAAALGPRCHRLGPLPRSRMPALLAACDAVPVPQSRTPFAESQVPAKALEAMAMARPVLASRVGDLPEMIGHARGWLYEPDEAAGLAGALAEVAADPREAARRGAEARTWFLAEASVAVNRARLASLVDRAPMARVS